MSRDFWIGMAVLPVAAACAAVVVLCVLALFRYFWRNDYVAGYVKYGQSNLKRVDRMANVLRVMSGMGHVRRLFLFYGWIVIIGREPFEDRSRRIRLAETDEDQPDPFKQALLQHWGIGEDGVEVTQKMDLSGPDS